jgi:hypothetical protein
MQHFSVTILRTSRLSRQQSTFAVVVPRLGSASIKGSTLRYPLALAGRATMDWLILDTDSEDISLGRGGNAGSAEGVESSPPLERAVMQNAHGGIWKRVGRTRTRCAI